MTTDKEEAIRFYNDLFGWKTKAVFTSTGASYTVWSSGDRDVAGVVLLDPQEPKASHWIPYITVEDIETAVGLLEDLGGSVRVPPTEIPEIGHFASVQDPDGAVFALFTFAHAAPPEETEPRPAGVICWNNLLTPHPERSGAFYKGLFGWTLSESDMGELGTYYLFQRGDRNEAGMIQAPSESPVRWLSYVRVDSVDAMVERAKGLGAKVRVDPRDIPEVGRFAVLDDPTGAAFAVFEIHCPDPEV